MDILDAINIFEAEVLSAKISTFGERVEDIFHIKKNNMGVRNKNELSTFKKLIESNIIKNRNKIVN